MNRCESKDEPRTQYPAHSALRTGVHLISFLICTLAVISCPAQQTSSDQQSNSDQHSVSDQLVLTTDSVGPRRFVAVHGRRSAIMGYPETGLEVWAYPFQILSNYQIG